VIEAAATIQPGHTFGLAFLRSVTAPRFGDPQAKEKLRLKRLNSEARLLEREVMIAEGRYPR
jgi:hypothetical protein